MLKDFLYVVGCFLCLAAMSVSCTGRDEYMLQKAVAYLETNEDSTRFYLSLVSPDRLSECQRMDYRVLCMYYGVGTDSLKDRDGFTAKAMEAYGKGNPFRPKAQMNRLNFLKSSREYEQTDVLLDRLATEWCRNGWEALWRMNKMNVKKHLAQEDSAEIYCKEMMDSGQCLYLIYMDRANDAIRSGNEDEGIEYLVQAMRHAPDSYHAGNCADRAVAMLRDTGKYREAMQTLETFRNYMERSQVPYWNFMKGELCLQMHRPDSALHYFRIATVAGNNHVMRLAYERISEIEYEGNRPYHAFTARQKASELIKDNAHEKVDNEWMVRRFMRLKAEQEADRMQIERQRSLILIIVLLSLFMLGTMGTAFYIYRYRKQMEQRRQEQDKRLLAQEREIALMKANESKLREQNAGIREELLRRIKVTEKLPELHDGHTAGEVGKRIDLSDDDWKELLVMIDSIYPGFVGRLRKGFPALTEKDVRFCALIKIGMSLQTLSDIYCISRASVSKKKLRLKEKLDVRDDGMSLDEWMKVF